MSVGFPPPYQNSVASAYLQSDQPLKGTQTGNTGSVLKPVVEANTITSTNHRQDVQPTQLNPSSANQAKSPPATGEQSKVQSSSQGSEAVNQDKSRRQQQLEDRQIRVEQQQIQQLSARDREVRNHERAHAAAGGQYAGAPRYQYERGPDGVNYAVSGEVPISTGAVKGDPQATIEKAQVVRRAALAPSEPSPQDRRVAAQATQMEVQARAELAELQRQERLEKNEALQGNTAVEETDQAEEEQALMVEPEEREPFFDLSEQQEIFNRLTTELSKRIIGSDVASQAPRPGQIVSRFA